MPKFLIDESLSPHLATDFQKHGFKASAVRDIELRGLPSFRRIISFLFRSQAFTDEYLGGALVVATEYAIRRHPAFETKKSS